LDGIVKRLLPNKRQQLHEKKTLNLLLFIISQKILLISLKAVFLLHFSCLLAEVAKRNNRKSFFIKIQQSDENEDEDVL
jgi:hypothetical protein